MVQDARMRMTDDDFGAYLQSVEERDIDLLLMEEFHVGEGFATWFAGLVGLSKAAVFDGAWHSLNDQDGETDLLLRMRDGALRVAILIENKICAPEQYEQDIRYHMRGARSQAAGRYDQFVTAICAPQRYLQGLPVASAYQHKISYELIRERYAGQPGPRAAWRRAIMEEAIQQGRRGYVMKVHAGKTAFHAAYREHLVSTQPLFVMARPGPKGPKSDWMLFKGADFPKGVKLVHKNDQGCLDLEFERTSAVRLEEQRRADWPAEVRAVPRGKKSAALSLPVPICDMERPLPEQIAKIEAAFEAAHRLAPLAVMLERLREA
jgi:hypothetical protein